MVKQREMCNGSYCVYCWARGSDRTDCVKGDQLFCNLYGRFVPVGRTRWALKMIIVKMQKGIPIRLPVKH